MKNTIRDFPEKVTAGKKVIRHFFKNSLGSVELPKHLSVNHWVIQTSLRK